MLFSSIFQKHKQPVKDFIYESNNGKDIFFAADKARTGIGKAGWNFKIMEYSNITLEELNMDLFSDFIRRQVVTKVWRRENGRWVIKEEPFIDDWSPEDLAFGISCIQNTIKTGGLLYGAFSDGTLKGFISVEAQIFGGAHKYMDLTSIHVSADMRKCGIGRILFQKAKEWAKEKGAEKLYISSHSAVESQAFYKSMGCREAAVYNTEHTEKEPFDIQLECIL